MARPSIRACWGTVIQWDVYFADHTLMFDMLQTSYCQNKICNPVFLQGYHIHVNVINPCPAEPGEALPLKTV